MRLERVKLCSPIIGDYVAIEASHFIQSMTGVGPANRRCLIVRAVDVPRALLAVGAFGERPALRDVHRLLGHLGFSAQKPARLARERNDVDVEDFRSRRWKAIKKSSS